MIVDMQAAPKADSCTGALSVSYAGYLVYRIRQKSVISLGLAVRSVPYDSCCRRMLSKILSLCDWLV